MVSLVFTRNVPAGATLNINNQGAKAIRWKGTALTAGIIKAGDRCLFMYNSGSESYYLLANDRWGVDIDALATVAHTGSYNDLLDKPTLFGGDYNDLTNKPNLAPVATSGDYNDLNNKPTIPTVPTNISAFVNDAGYLTAIPDSLGGVCIESDPIFSAWNKDYNDLTNKPNLAPVATSGDYNDLTNKPANPDFGHGLVRTNVNNPSGATDINVTFTGYQLMNGGMVSLGFTRNVPAGATLNINNQGAKAIRWKGTALTAGIIKAGDRCLFMYNSGSNSYYLLANDRWGMDIDALATVAQTGSYNDLTDKPEFPTVPTNVSSFTNDAGYLTGYTETDPQFNAWDKNYNDLTNKPTIPTVPANVSAFNNDAGYITGYTETDPMFNAWNKDYNDLINKPVNATFGQGIVRTNVNNPSGVTDITVAFTGYQLVTGGIVSLGFVRNVPAGATLNINNQGAKAIRWKGVALTAGIIKAGDRCLFMYNSGSDSYYLLANDRWGVDIDALATVAHTGSYNDLTDKPTIPTAVSALDNDAGYITSEQVPAQVNADWNATSGVAKILHKPNLATVATSGNYNDLTNKPTIPTVPTNLSAFVNDMGYLTSIPDSFGGISIESDPIFSAWDKDYNDLTNRPVLFSGNYNDLTNKPTLFSGDYNDLVNQPANADFGHGIVRTNVNNPAGATDINAAFTGYQAVNGGMVSLGFTRNVPAGATLNINNQGAKTIRWKGTALTDGIIKAGDRCLFMYNAGNNSYYLLANDRWGVDIDALATVAHTGSYNDLTDKPTIPTTVSALDNDAGYITSEQVPAQVNADWNATSGAAQILHKPNLATVATSGNYNDLTNKPTLPTVNNGTLTIQQNGANLGTFTANQSSNQTVNIATITLEEVQSLINSGLSAMQNELDNMSFVCGISKVTDYDGNEYNTVKIGNQCWTKENLRTEHYADGTAIPVGTDTSSFVGYRYNFASSIIPVEKRGYLYNWSAVMHDAATSEATPSGVQGICPTGWHVPSDAEWTLLTDYVGSQSQYLCGGNSNAIAKALATTTGWDPSPEECSVSNDLSSNNATGFSAFPAGKYGTYGTAGYSNPTSEAHFWSATAVSGHNSSYRRYLSRNNANVVRTNSGKYYGYSVRCLRDVADGAMSDVIQTLQDSLQSQNDALQEQNDALQEQLDNMSFVCGISKVTDYDGNEYNTVKIGNQCWTKENLRSEHYADGTEIPAGTSASAVIGYRYNYTTSSIPLELRGYLYNWPAVMHGAASSNANPSGVQGVCPTGWHVPGHDEWIQLFAHLESNSQYLCGSGLTSTAKALAATSWWDSSSQECAIGNDLSANNASGFSAVPTLFTDGNSFLGVSGSSANFWTSTEGLGNTDAAYFCYLDKDNDSEILPAQDKSDGYSVRCIRDAAGSPLSDIMNDLQGQNSALQEQLDSLQEVVDALTGVSFKCGISKMTDVDGNEYNTVQIGDQCWMKENLRTTKYADGTPISDGGSNSSETTPYYYDYTTYSIPLAQRGYFYNWPAVMNGASSSDAVPSGVQGICPTGWHVPSDAEWTAMEATQTSMTGLSYFAWRGDHAGKLAGAGWEFSSEVGAPGNVTDSTHNASGFSAVPAGYFVSGCSNIRREAVFWSCTQYNDTLSIRRCLFFNRVDVERQEYDKRIGYSVRCLRD